MCGLRELSNPRSELSRDHVSNKNHINCTLQRCSSSAFVTIVSCPNENGSCFGEKRKLQYCTVHPQIQFGETPDQSSTVLKNARNIMDPGMDNLACWCSPGVCTYTASREFKCMTRGIMSSSRKKVQGMSLPTLERFQIMTLFSVAHPPHQDYAWVTREQVFVSPQYSGNLESHGSSIELSTSLIWADAIICVIQYVRYRVFLMHQARLSAPDDHPYAL